MGKLVDDLIGKTEEFLQPNPGKNQKKINYKIGSFIAPPDILLA